MKFLLVSRFNTQNIGDLVISNQLKRELEKYAETSCLSLFGKIDQFCDINNIRNDSSNISNSQNTSNISKAIQKLKIKTNELFKKRRIERLLDSNTTMVIGGGNMLCDLNHKSDSTKRFLPFINAAIKKKSKIFAIDIGIGPFATKQQYDKSIQLLNKFDHISFRDVGSYLKYIDNKGEKDKAEISVDPAFFFNKKSHREALIKNKVGINIIDIRLLGKGEHEFRLMQESFIELARSIRDNLECKVIFFATDLSDESALQVIEDLISCEPGIEIRKINGYNDLILLYTSIDVLIGTRMHSLILAFNQLLPVVGLSWQDKVKDMFETIGFNDALFILDDLHDNIDNITSYCIDVYNDYPNNIKKVEDSYGALIKMKSIDDRIIRKIIQN